MFDQEYMNAFQACSAQALVEDRGRRRLQKEQERRERIEDAAEAQRRSTLPVVEELKSLVEGLQEQNRILPISNRRSEKGRRGSQKRSQKGKNLFLDFLRCGHCNIHRRACYFNYVYVNKSEERK